MFDVTSACADAVIVNRATAEVAVVPKRKKVAIVGFATNTLHLVPWLDPTFEIWGMNQGYLHCVRRADRWFEMHLPDALPDIRDPQYLTFLKTLTIPLYMIQCYDEFPSSMRYPIEEATHYGGRDYYMSSVAFMLAVAGIEGFEEVHLYGINLAIGEEWFYEKANCEWWIGLLEGRNIKVVVPHASSLLKQYRRYGYFVDARPAQQFRALLQARIGEYQTRAERLQADFHVVVGAKREAESLLQVAEGSDHGADVVLMPVPVPST